MPEKPEEEGLRSRSREEIVRAIERGFETAKKPPVHLTNPSLIPVEVLPVFPDVTLWQNIYSQVIFDADPLAGRIPTNDADKAPELQNEIALKAIVKGLSTDGSQNSVVYFAPKPSNSESNGKEKESAVEENGSSVLHAGEEYDWVREYAYHVDQGVRHIYFFMWTKDCVKYSPIDSRVSLDKIKSKAVKHTTIIQKERPAHIFRTERELLEEEMQAQEERKKLLFGGVDPEDLEDNSLSVEKP